MTPRVRWRVPRGRIAFSGIEGVGRSGSVVAGWGEVTGWMVGDGEEMVGEATAAVKCWREVRSWGVERGVRRGRQRKWVRGGRRGRGGRGGIVVMGVEEGDGGRVLVGKGEGRGWKGVDCGLVFAGACMSDETG